MRTTPAAVFVDFYKLKQHVITHWLPATMIGEVSLEKRNYYIKISLNQQSILLWDRSK